MEYRLWCKISVIAILFIAGCIGKPSSIQPDMPLFDDSIIGKWRAEILTDDLNGSIQKQYFVKFIDEQKLKYCFRSPENQFCTNFSYYPTTEGDIFVSNARFNGGTWTYNLQDEDLLICIWQKSNCILFERDSSRFNILLEVFNIFRE